MPKKKQKQLMLTLVKSPIGYSKKQKATLKALGLNRMSKSVQVVDNEAIRGMIDKVSHLIVVDQT